MANEVTTSEGNLPATNEAPNFFQLYGESIAPTQIVGSLLTFNKFGEYKAGQDKTTVPYGTRLMFNMESFQHGWMKWVDNKPAGNKMGYLSEGFVPAQREALGDLDESMWETFDDGRAKDPWQRVNNIIAMDYDTGELYTFTTSSKGGLSALGEICLAYGNRMRSNPGEMPVVELAMREYEHPNKAYGTIRNPKFNIIGWEAPPDGLLDAKAGGAATDEPKELAKPAPAPKQIEAKAAPARTSTAIPPKGGAKVANAPSAKPAGKAPPARGKGAGTKGVRFA